MLTAPADAMIIKATGQMWKWTFTYPDGKVTDSLVVPIDEPVKLELESKDVLHSLYIPAFRIKQDVAPGINNMMWFIAQKKGTYDILCAEYCGQLHAYMLTTITVIDRSDYDTWLLTEPDLSNQHPGLTILQKNACLSCHTQDGSRLVGPSFKGIAGLTETVIIDGTETEITIDRDYIIQSIKEPNAAIVKGYQKGLMISYDGIISEEDLNHVVDYLESLK
jgi:cytochrome c oxidase subunit 2